MDEKIANKRLLAHFGDFAKIRPTKNQCAENAPKMPFSGRGSAFFGFPASSSSSWPDSWPILPNLGRFRAIFLFLGVIVSFFMSQELHFFVHLRCSGSLAARSMLGCLFGLPGKVGAFRGPGPARARPGPGPGPGPGPAPAPAPAGALAGGSPTKAEGLSTNLAYIVCSV